MTPWIHGFVGRDQRFSRSPYFRKKSLLPWQSFEVDWLYATFFLVLIVAATVSHKLVIENYSDKENFVFSAYINSFKSIWLTTGFTALLSIIPCLGCFVLSVYSHALECSPEEGSGDCTRFVKFRDPILQERYRGRRIDMESLYEMYFDEKLDFISPDDRDACEVADSPTPCLMKDILARRDEFVSYTFGLTTHLKFLVLKWVPDVLSHSKSQDVEQVRDHYDRSKYYAQNEPAARSQPKNPFTSDVAEDDFFGMFLGEAMVYTSGISQSLVVQQQKLTQEQNSNGGKSSSSSSLSPTVGHETVEAMQDCKLKLLCKKMRMQKGDSHLDIGCGWGTLVNFAAANYGTIGTGVTLSRNQVDVYDSALGMP